MALKKFKLQVASAKVSGTHTDFPAYVDLSNMPSSFWDNVTNGGGDIRCYSDETLTTELPREVVSCDTATDTGELWVKTGMTTTTVVYITVDGTSTEPSASATYGKNNTWNSGYKGVYHLQTGNDSTSNANNGSGAFSAGASGGQIGGAINFNGSSQYMKLGHISSFYTPNSSTELTVSAWIKADATNGTRNISVYGDGSHIWIFRLNSGNLQAYIRESGGTYRLASSAYTDTTNLNYVVLSYGSDDVNRLYVNGSETNTVNGDGTLFNGPDDPPCIGAYTTPSDYFDGIIDEVRISNVGRSANWITTEYNNQDDPGTFWTISEIASANTSAFFQLF